MNEEKLEKLVSRIEPFMIVVIICCFVGVFCGVVGAFFLKTIDIFVNFREAFYYIIFTMPVIGILIAYLNKKYHCGEDGTYLVNKAITKEKNIPDYVAPSLFITTTLSHLAGASVGRMEAPIKMGGAIGHFIAKFFDLKKEYRGTVIACGVSSLFGAVFGLPVTGTILAWELCFSKNRKKPILVLPVLLGACFGRFVCFAFGLDSFIDRMLYLHHPEFSLGEIIPILILIGICLGFTLVFNHILKYFKDLFAKIKNEYIRIIVGSIIMIGAICLMENTIFCGNDTALVEQVLNNNSMWYVFILKTILTALCLAIGFRGGNIGPAFIAGATLGIVVASLLGIDPLLGAAIGAVCLFGGVTGCYVSAVMLGIELFGIASGFFYIIIAVMIRYFITNGYIERKF